jgi:hypothetical protein
MFTKPLTRHSITTVDISKDTESISRLLVAAAVNPGFCSKLLADPRRTVQAGFGGEGFPLSRPTLEALSGIRASSLPEFALQLTDMLTNSPHSS